MKETDLFEPVKEWLEDGGYEVYSEVQHGQGGKRADTVAICDPIVTVVELKTSLSLDLIEQAVYWRQHANYVFVAIPHPKREINRYAMRLLRQEGIGLLSVRFVKDFLGERSSVEREHYCVPRLNRRPSEKIRESITDHHKDGPPGGHQGGGYVTPYSITMKNVREFLSRSYRFRSTDGWATVKDILDGVTTHYSSPKSSLAKSLLSFEAEWCESKKEGGKLWFRFKPELPEAVRRMERGE